MHEIPDTGSIHELADYFSEKETQVKKIVLFEVCGIILSDHNVGENEQEAFDYIKKVLALDTQVTEEIVSVANDLKIIRDRIADIVFHRFDIDQVVASEIQADSGTDQADHSNDDQRGLFPAGLFAVSAA